MLEVATVWLDWLQYHFPVPGFTVVLEVDEDLDDPCIAKKTGRRQFTIYLRPMLTRAELSDGLVHEYAHCYTWNHEIDGLTHGVMWSAAAGYLYRRFVNTD